MESLSSIISPSTWTQPLPLKAIFDSDKPFGSAPWPTRAVGSGRQDRPLEVDLGCGKGRFILVRAKANPNINFLGIDRLLRRLQKVDRKIARQGLSNIRLIRIEASYAVNCLLPALSVTTFYIFFPDPWPKRRHYRRRLFAESFLDSLHRTLLPGGHIHLATDHQNYFDEIRDLFHHDPRFSEVPAFEPTEEERTDFELRFLEQEAQIGRCSFRKTAPYHYRFGKEGPRRRRPAAAQPMTNA